MSGEVHLNEDYCEEGLKTHKNVIEKWQKHMLLVQAHNCHSFTHFVGVLLSCRIKSFFFQFYYRRRVLHHLVKGIIRRTLCAVGVAAHLTTSKNRLAPNVDILQPKSGAVSFPSPVVTKHLI